MAKTYACLRKREKFAGDDSQGNNPQVKIQGKTLEGFVGVHSPRGFFLSKFPWNKIRQIQENRFKKSQS